MRRRISGTVFTDFHLDRCEVSLRLFATAAVYSLLWEINLYLIWIFHTGQRGFLNLTSGSTGT